MKLQAYAQNISKEHQVTRRQAEKVNTEVVKRPERDPDAVAPGWRMWIEELRGRRALIVQTLLGAVLSLGETSAESRSKFGDGPAGPAHFRRGMLEARLILEGDDASVVLSGPSGLHVEARAVRGPGEAAGAGEPNASGFVTADVINAALEAVKSAGKPVDFDILVEQFGESVALRVAEHPNVKEEPIGVLNWAPDDA